MATIAAIGEETRVRGFALVGVLVFAAQDAAQVRAAWQDLPDDVSVVILTTAAATALPGHDDVSGGPLVAVMT